jgi:chromosome segregation ATPase
LLSLALAGAVFAQTASMESPGKPAPATTQPMHSTTEAHHHMMTINHDGALEHSRALYHYARNTNGELDAVIVQEHIDGIDQGLAKADKHLTKIEEHAGKEIPKEQTETTQIHADYRLAFEHVDKLKAAAKMTPLDKKAIETEAEAIYQQMKKARTQMARLQNNLKIRQPEKLPVRTSEMTPASPQKEESRTKNRY